MNLSQLFGQRGKKVSEERVSWKERISALRNLPAFFKLVWQTSPWYTIADILVRVIRSAIPVATLYVGKLIIDLVVLLIRHPGTFDTNRIWKLVVLEFALAILSDGLGRLTTLIDSLLGDLFANHTTVLIMEHAPVRRLQFLRQAGKSQATDN
jgi:ATP-binding cassette subfamily B protein